MLETKLLEDIEVLGYAQAFNRSQQTPSKFDNVNCAAILL